MRKRMYEVYEKRALYKSFTLLPMLDRDFDFNKAKASAIAWGGLVIEMEAEIRQLFPMVREVVSWRIRFMHTGKAPAITEAEATHGKTLMIRLNEIDRRPGQRKKF